MTCPKCGSSTLDEKICPSNRFDIELERRQALVILVERMCGLQGANILNLNEIPGTDGGYPKLLKSRGR